MKIRTVLLLALISGNVFAEEVPKPQLGYIPDMTSPAVLQKVERFLDEYIDPKHSPEYRQVVGEVLLTQLNFCDGTGKPQRTTISGTIKDDGETIISLFYGNYGMTPNIDSIDRAMKTAMVLRNKSVVALNCYLEETSYRDEHDEFDANGYTYPVPPVCFDDVLLETIAKITTLERLELCSGRTTDTGLKKLAPLTQLKSLRFIECASGGLYRFSYAAFDSLHDLVNLEELDLKNRPNITGHSYQAGADSAPLFRALPNYPKLRKFSAFGLELNRKHMEALTSCEKLESLDISGTLTEPCLDLLGKLKSLKTFSLTPRTNSLAVELPPLQALKELDLTIIGTEPPKVIVSNQPSLAKIELRPITKKIQLVFTDMPELAQILIHTVGDVVETIEPRFENLPKLSLFLCRDYADWYYNDDGVFTRPGGEKNLRFTQSFLQAVQNLPALESLHLRGSLDDNIDLNSLFRSCPKLSDLSLVCDLPDDFRLEDMPALKRLNIRSSTGKNIVIKNAPLLFVFDFSGRNVKTEDGKWKLVPDLESIVFEGCPNLIGFTYDSGSEKFRLLDLRGTKIKKESELSRFQRGVLNTKVLFD